MKTVKSKFKLTQSMMKDWKKICPRVFEAKYILKTLDVPPTEAMIWGNYFEYLCIGANVRGGVPELTDTMEKSAYKGRVLKQVEVYKKTIEHYKVTDIQPQVEKEAVLLQTIEDTIIEIPIIGTDDIVCKIDNERAIIDLKFTGDVTNEWGDFAWGAPHKMDLLQAKHYPLIWMLAEDEKCIFQYWIFDRSPKMGAKILHMDASPEAFEWHKRAIFDIWNEIQYSINTSFLSYPKYAECRECPLSCNARLNVPEVEFIILNN